MRKFLLLAFVILLTLQGTNILTDKNDKPFFTYINGKPAIWKSTEKICLSFVDRPQSLNSSSLEKISIDFKLLTGIDVNAHCMNPNVEIQFGNRSELSYLRNNSAVGATVVFLQRTDKHKIVGGRIQIDGHFYSQSANKTRKELLLHELGHIIGFAHSNDGGIMMPVLNEIRHEKYTSAGILELISQTRIKK